MSTNCSCVQIDYVFAGDETPYPQIRYGLEPTDWGASSGKTCRDCGCPPGAYHHLYCDVECCPKCFGQAITCNCELQNLS
jgi:hypothetical protein